MDKQLNREVKLAAVEQAELAEVVGGVMPVYDARTGEVITCTDPRRWGGGLKIPLTPPILRRLF